MSVPGRTSKLFHKWKLSKLNYSLLNCLSLKAFNLECLAKSFFLFFKRHIFFLISGSIPSCKKSKGCVLENLQYHVHWIARCPRSRLFQNSQWRKEHLCKIWVRLCSLIFYHLTIIIQLCMWVCVISETWMRNKLYCCFSTFLFDLRT